MNLNAPGIQPSAPNVQPHSPDIEQENDVRAADLPPVMRTAQPPDSAPSGLPNSLEDMTSSEPSLSSSSVRTHYDGPEAFLEALSAMNISTAMALLDAGLSPFEIVRGQSLLHWATEMVRDEKLFSTILRAAEPQKRNLNALDFYKIAFKNKNGVALKCLLDSNVPFDGVDLGDALSKEMIVAVANGNAQFLEILFQLKRRRCPDLSTKAFELLNWCHRNFDGATLEVLLSEFDSDDKPTLKEVSAMFYQAVSLKQEAFVQKLLEWMKSSGKYTTPDSWPLFNSRPYLADAELLLLARIGYPPFENFKFLPIPQSEKTCAQLQDILFGKDLIGSELGKLIAADCSSTELFFLVARLFQSSGYALLPTNDTSIRFLHSLIASGVRKPVAITLVNAYIDGNKAKSRIFEIAPHSFDSLSLSMISDSMGGQDLLTSDDPLVRKQSEAFQDMAVDKIGDSLGGGPVAFFVSLMDCIGFQGVDEDKVLAITKVKMGIPPMLVPQILKILHSSWQAALGKPLAFALGPEMALGAALNAISLQLRYQTIVGFAHALPEALKSYEVLAKTNSINADADDMLTIHVWVHTFVSLLLQYCDKVNGQNESSRAELEAALMYKGTG